MIHLDELIGVVAGLITIAVTGGSIWAWVRSHTFVVQVHDPAKPVRGDKLSIVDIEKAMQRMVEDARQYGPDQIVGINRGGAIVGGWLAKQLKLQTPALLVVNSDQPPGDRVALCMAGGGTVGSRIYLVDDAKRKGEHMREAISYLNTTHGVGDIRSAVLLQMYVPHGGPETHAFKSAPCDFSGLKTNDASVSLPWDSQ